MDEIKKGIQKINVANVVFVQREKASNFGYMTFCAEYARVLPFSRGTQFICSPLFPPWRMRSTYNNKRYKYENKSAATHSIYRVFSISNQYHDKY